VHFGGGLSKETVNTKSLLLTHSNCGSDYTSSMYCFFFVGQFSDLANLGGGSGSMDMMTPLPSSQLRQQQQEFQGCCLFA